MTCRYCGHDHLTTGLRCLKCGAINMQETRLAIQPLLLDRRFVVCPHCLKMLQIGVGR